MSISLPDWFQAGRVFSGRNGWHVGSPSGLSVGPYVARDEAMAASSQVQLALSRATTADAQADVMRQFVSGQTSHIMESDPAARVISVRIGERSKFWVRTSRYFKVGEVWFFHTREGVDVGPYSSEAMMEREAANLVAMLSSMAEETEASRRAAIHAFMRRAIE